MSAIERLPFEIFHIILDYLDPEDVFRLSMTSRGFHHVTRDSSIGRVQMCNAVPYAPEAEAARLRSRPSLSPTGTATGTRGGYARSLRAWLKRQQAISNLEPFAAACVAWADAYIYTSQMLVYVRDRTLYMLPLSADTTVRHETRVDVRALLDDAVPESKDMRRYTFRPLHCADGIVSCIYAHHRLGPNAPNGQENWLVFFAPATGWHMSCRLPFPHHRLFVRNNSTHIIYGMYTARTQIAPAPEQPGVIFPPQHEDGGVDHHRHWRIRAYSMVHQAWSADDSWQLDDCLGLGEFGKDCCFELIDGYFYALSNRQRFLDMDHEAQYTSQRHRDDYYLSDDDDDDDDDDYDNNNNNNNNNDNDYSGGAGGTSGGTSARASVDRAATGGNIDDTYYVSDDDAAAAVKSGVNSGRSSPVGSIHSTHSNDSHDSHDSHDSGGGGGGGSTHSRISRSENNNNDPPAHTRASLFAKSSHYTVLRLRVPDNVNAKPVLEQPTLKSRWRRRNSEGPLDDRWTTLKLQKSAATGDMVIIESRKEWLQSSSSSRRSYYMQPLVWPRDLRKQRKQNVQKKMQSQLQNQQNKSALESALASISSCDFLPSTPNKRLPRRSDLEPSCRLPSAVHPGDNASLMDPLTLSMCRGRFYAKDASTYLDLIDQDTMSPTPTQKLVLRSGSRSLLHTAAPLRPAAADPTAAANDEADIDNAFYPIKQINRTYSANDVHTWPRTMPGDSPADKALLDALVNPEGCNGGVTAAWDDRVLVYATKATTPSAGRPNESAEAASKLKPLHAIVVVSFDPTLCLPGLKAWGQRNQQQQQSQPQEAQAAPPAPPAPIRELADSNASTPRWVSLTEPAYVGINNGYDFSYHKTG